MNKVKVSKKLYEELMVRQNLFDYHKRQARELAEKIRQDKSDIEIVVKEYLAVEGYVFDNLKQTDKDKIDNAIENCTLETLFTKQLNYINYKSRYQILKDGVMQLAKNGDTENILKLLEEGVY